MNQMLAPRMLGIRPSPTAAVSDRARALVQEGKAIINLGEGELDFDTPDHIKTCAIEAIRRGETKYTAVAGTAALRKAIIDKFARENALAFSEDEVIAGTGAKQLIFNALFATVGEGDEVIVPAPYWVSYPDMVRLAGGAPSIVTCEENNGWKLRPEALEAAIRPKTKWLLLNSPGNPSGAVYTRDELLALGQVLLKHEHVLVLSDDIYEHIRFRGPFHTLAEVEPGLRRRVVTVNGVSKTHSMTGWRIGYAGGPAWLVSAMSALQSQSTSNPSSISQAAAVAALNLEADFIQTWVDVLRDRRDLARSILRDARGLHCTVPDGAFYLFVNCEGLIGKRTPLGGAISSDIDLSAYLLEQAGVAVVPGDAFGVAMHFRLAFGVPTAALESACRSIVAACNELD